jgi:hypothetical protein
VGHILEVLDLLRSHSSRHSTHDRVLVRVDEAFYAASDQEWGEYGAVG